MKGTHMTDQVYGSFTDDEDVLDAPVHTEGQTKITASAVTKDLFGELVAEFKKDANLPSIFVPVPLRKGWVIELSPNISNAEFQRYQRAAQGKKKVGQGQVQNLNFLLLNALAIVEHTVALHKETPAGRAAVLDEDGDPVTFTHPDLMAQVGATTAVDAAKAFIGDAHIVSIGNTLIDRAGWGDEVQAEDPTGA